MNDTFPANTYYPITKESISPSPKIVRSAMARYNMTSNVNLNSAEADRQTFSSPSSNREPESRSTAFDASPSVTSKLIEQAIKELDDTIAKRRRDFADLNSKKKRSGGINRKLVSHFNRYCLYKLSFNGRLCWLKIS